MNGYPAGVATVNPQTTVDGPMLSVVLTAVEVQWPSATTGKTIFKAQSNYKWYFVVGDDDAGFSTDVLAEAVEKIDEKIAKGALWETSDG